MKAFFNGIRETVAPRPGERHGPLPPLLLGLTAVTGLVDAFSYLVLGHVFVANMTGNVVFLGFALAGAPGFSIGASLVALGSFGLGALAGGEVGVRLGQDRGHQLSASVSGQAALLAVCVLLAAVSAQPVPGGFRYPLIVALAVAMGLQNATVRKLAVPDLPTTNVLTTTITAMAADSEHGRLQRMRAPGGAPLQWRPCSSGRCWGPCSFSMSPWSCPSSRRWWWWRPWRRPPACWAARTLRG